MGFALVLNITALMAAVSINSTTRANERKNAYYERTRHEMAGHQH